MPRIDSVETDELRTELRRVDAAKPAQRLMVAIAYKQGVSQSELADWFGFSRKTIHNWFDRMEREPLDRAIRDESRPGRPPKLDDSARKRLRTHLHTRPTAFGYDATTWTVPLVQDHVEEAFDVSYTSNTIRRLVRELDQSQILSG